MPGYDPYRLWVKTLRYIANDDAIMAMCGVVRKDTWRPWRWKRNSKLISECFRLVAEQEILADEIKQLIRSRGDNQD